MMDPSQVPPIDAEEHVARFATQSNHFRSNGTVKQDLFMPNRQGETSVMRHRQATDPDIWMVGSAVASGMQPPRTLYGRADVGVQACVSSNLRVVASPLSGNPNHADLVGWPDSKPDQKSVALKLAAASRWVKAPAET